MSFYVPLGKCDNNHTQDTSSKNIILNWTKNTSGTLYTQYYDGGPIYNVGYADGKGNIILNDTFAVKYGDTLTVSFGVNIKFKGYYCLNINGDINAYGTSAELISFLNMRDTKEGGEIHFYANAGRFSNLSFCIFDKCPIGIQNSGKQKFYDCFFNNSGISIFGSGAGPQFIRCEINGIISENGADPVLIENTLISAGITCKGCSPKIYNNSFYNCGIEICDDYRNFYGDKPCRPNISNNKIIGASIGISCCDNAVAWIENNEINRCDTGIIIKDSVSATLMNNQITNCGLGISVCNFANCTFYDNVLSENLNGTSISSEGVVLLQNNTIFNNTHYGIVAIDRNLPNLEDNTFENMGLENHDGVACQCWSIYVYIRDQHGYDINGAKLSVKDTFGNEYAPYGGKYYYYYDHRVIVREYAISNEWGTIKFNPYAIEVIYQGFNNLTKGWYFNLTSDKTIVILLHVEHAQDWRIFRLTIFAVAIVICVILVFMFIYHKFHRAKDEYK